MPERLSPCATVLAFMTSSIAAQTTWVVPDGADPDVYIAQAAPGDTLQLGAEHPGFTLDKGLTVLGPANIRDATYPYDEATVQLLIPPGQQARFVAVRFIISGGFSGPGTGNHVRIDGDVAFEDCDFIGSSSPGGPPAAMTVNSGHVVLARCEVAGAYGSTGLRIVGGSVSVADSSLYGAGSDSYVFTSPKSAVLQEGGELFVSASFLRGGRGATTFNLGMQTYDAVPAMVQQGGVARISDSELRGGEALGFSFAKAAPALAGYGFAYVARTQLIDGTSPMGLTGPTTGDVPDPAMVGVSMTTPLRLSQPYSVVGTAGDSQGLFASIGTFDLSVTSGAPLVEPLYGTIGSHIVLTLAAPAAGQQVVTTGSVPGTASLVGAAVWFQCLQLDGAAVRLSPVVGGTIL